MTSLREAFGDDDGCPCDPGNYCKDGKCTPCSAGTYQMTGGLTYCDQCQPGSYQQNQGQTSCSTCPPGTYNDSYGATERTDCAAGTYSSAGASSCSSCAAGTYSDATGATSSSTCTDCAAGTYSDSNGATECTACDAGKYSSAGASSCLSDCPPGYYQDGAKCTSCPSGETSGTGAKSSSDCVEIQCSANYLKDDGITQTKEGDPVACSGSGESDNTGNVANADAICLESAPYCDGYFRGKTLGKCQTAPSDCPCPPNTTRNDEQSCIQDVTCAVSVDGKGSNSHYDAPNHTWGYWYAPEYWGYNMNKQTYLCKGEKDLGTCYMFNEDYYDSPEQVWQTTCITRDECSNNFNKDSQDTWTKVSWTPCGQSKFDGHDQTTSKPTGGWTADK